MAQLKITRKDLLKIHSFKILALITQTYALVIKMKIVRLEVAMANFMQ